MRFSRMRFISTRTMAFILPADLSLLSSFQDSPLPQFQARLPPLLELCLAAMETCTASNISRIHQNTSCQDKSPQGKELVAEREVTIGTSGVVDVNIDIDSNKISAGDWITATTTRIISGTPTHTHRFSLGIQAN